MMMGVLRRVARQFKSSITYKWLLLLIAVTIIPLLILGTVSYSITKDAIDKKVADASKQLISQTVDNIDISFSGYKDMVMQLITSPEIMPLLQRLKNRDESVVENLSLTSKLAYYTAVSPEFKSVSFMTESMYIKGIFRWDDQEDYKNDFYNQTMAAGNSFVWFPTRLGLYSDTADSHQAMVFSVAKQVFNVHDGRQLDMVVVLDIREEMLSDILKKNTRSESGTESFLIDKQGNIISHTDKSMLLTSVDQWFEVNGSEALYSGKTEDSFVSHYKGKEVMVNYLKLQTNDWKVVHVIERSSLYKDSDRVIQVIVIIMLAGIVFSIITAYVMARSVSSPLKKMVRAMNQVHIGNLAARIDEDKNRIDEIGSLQHHFNDMVAKIEELLQVVYQEQNNKRIAEVKALEAQINPHFLYNTLDAIKWTALFQKANNAAEMARLLSRLLHISIGKGKDTVFVQEEIEHVECYLGIQNLRASGKIEVRYDIADEVKMYRTPKVILQPIVENAIMHGFADQTEGGAIAICCREEDNRLLFEITDNGHGFEQAVYSPVASFADEAGSSRGASFLGVGLSNVSERIKLICGQEYGLGITSKPGEGTTVVITLPIMKGGNSHV